MFIKENPTVPSKIVCCICGFFLDIEGGSGNEDNKKTWYDFVVEKEHVFIRNIYSKKEIAEVENISDITDYHGEFGRFIKIGILLKKLLNNPRWENFFTMI